MYKLSLKKENVNTYRPDIVLRTAPKVKMKVDFTDKERVRCSPYYLCVNLWDKLNSTIQTSRSLYEFSKSMCRLNLAGL